MKMKLLFIALFSLLIISSMIFFSFSAFAEEEPPLPSLSANDLTAIAGKTVTVYIFADNFVDVGAIDIYAFYDSSVFTISSTSKQGFASRAQTEITTDIPGEACFSAVAPNGMSGNGYIWSITFKVNENAKEGNYYVILAVGDAYSVDHTPIFVSSDKCSIAVSAPETTVVQKSINVYSSGGYYQYKKGDTIQIDYYTSSANGLAAANFLLTYDADYLQPTSVVLNDKLKNSAGALYSLNDRTIGYRRLAYASLEGLNGYVQLLSVTFSVIGEVTSSESTEVTLDVSGLYDSELAIMTGTEVTKTIQFYAEKVDSRPVISLNEHKIDNNVISLVVTAPGETNLAAGDFVVNFDSSVWKCISVKNAQEDCMVISNIKQNEGKITFSFISENGIASDSILAIMEFESLKCSKESNRFVLSGKNLVNSKFDTINSVYSSNISTTVHKYSVTITNPTCTANGFTTYTCTCGYSYTDSDFPALTHDISKVSAKPATCTEIGWNEYEKCSRCEYTTYVEIPMVQHKYTSVIIKPQLGVQGYTLHTCSVCGDSFKDNYTDALTYIYGDTNGDGIIDGRDVLLLRQYMAALDYDTGISSVEVHPGADANGDGVVNGRDVLLMRKYMANYDYDTGSSTVVLGPQ